MLYFFVLLYISLMYIRPAEIFPEWATFPFADIVAGFAAVAAGFSLLLKPRAFLNLPQDKLLLVFWTLIFVATVPVWIVLAQESWLGFMPVVFCYFLIRVGVRNQRQFRGLAYLLIVLNLFQAINGIVEYNTGVGLGNVAMVAGRIYGTGIFNDPNDLGMTFVMAIPLILGVVLNRNASIIARVCCFVTLPPILLAIYYTNSRGALVGLTACLICYAFMRLGRVRAWGIAIVLLIIIGVAAPSRGAEMDYSEMSAQGRIQSWAEGLAMFKSSPVVGVGYAQYTEHSTLVAHNSFVHTLAELGFLGAFCLVGMFYWYFRGLLLGGSNTPELKHWREALLASGAGVVGCAMFLSRQYVVVPYILLGLGTSASTLSMVDSTQLRMTGRDVRNIVVITVSAVVFVYLAVRTLAIWSGG
jgi:putative inorganic carbon (HCO3(-)) transporter